MFFQCHIPFHPTFSWIENEQVSNWITLRVELDKRSESTVFETSLLMSHLNFRAKNGQRTVTQPLAQLNFDHSQISKFWRIRSLSSSNETFLMIFKHYVSNLVSFKKNSLPNHWFVVMPSLSKNLRNCWPEKVFRLLLQSLILAD